MQSIVSKHSNPFNMHSPCLPNQTVGASGSANTTCTPHVANQLVSAQHQRHQQQSHHHQTHSSNRHAHSSKYNAQMGQTCPTTDRSNKQMRRRSCSHSCSSAAPLESNCSHLTQAKSSHEQPPLQLAKTSLAHHESVKLFPLAVAIALGLASIIVHVSGAPAMPQVLAPSGHEQVTQNHAHNADTSRKVNTDKQQIISQQTIAQIVEAATLWAADRARSKLVSLVDNNNEINAPTLAPDDVASTDNDDDEIIPLVMANGNGDEGQLNSQHRAISFGRLIKRSGISDQRLAEIQMIRALKKQLERATKLAVESNQNSGSGDGGGGDNKSSEHSTK